MDVRPLTEPVDRAALKAHQAQLKASGRAPSGFTLGTVLPMALVGFFTLSMLNGVFFGFVGVFDSGIPPLPVLVSAFLPLLILAGVIAGAVALFLRVRRARALRNYRLDRFAAANGLTWHPTAPAPPLPGLIFGQGRDRRASDILRGDRPRFVEFGNYRYTTGSDKHQKVHQWGYIAIKLATPLPHIVLDAVGNNGLFGSNLPTGFQKDQRLSLEGDFDRHFELYCPAGYERDALYLFTPDVMARLIDNAAELDVEIIDDWLFLYAKRDLATLDPRTWAWLFSVVGALLDKLGQWERWRDDRLAGRAVDSANDLPFAAPVEARRPPPGVAAEGRRLKGAVPWAAILTIGGIAVVWLLAQSGVLFSLFGG